MRRGRGSRQVYSSDEAYLLRKCRWKFSRAEAKCDSKRSDFRRRGPVDIIKNLSLGSKFQRGDISRILSFGFETLQYWQIGVVLA